MGDLSQLVLRTAYHKGRDNIADDFYLPCMRLASAYDRAVGYFRSAAFIVAWPALRDFVQREGRIRVLCSQILAEEDVNALEEGYSARADSTVTARVLEEVRGLLRDPVLRAPARILAALVANGTIEFKIAIIRHDDLHAAKGRIFHDKLGIFRDETGNAVTFKGSMNETWSGLSADGNLESVDVSATWMGARDMERVQYEESYFRDIWNNNYPTLHVRPFPEVARNELETAAEPDWEAGLERLLSEGGTNTATDPRGRVLKSHQAAGLASWTANGRRGILEFATGSGKTFTAITAIREAIAVKHEPVLVVVPDQVLFRQWYNELSETTADLNVSILRAGAGHDLWRTSLSLWTRPDEAARLVLATVQTASSDEFLRNLVPGNHLTIVADEVHRLGSPGHRNLMRDITFGARLGLSATPDRAGDPAGTAAILEFFGGILEPRYTLADAIRDEVLCKYFYRPHTLRLDEDEADEWRAITRELAQLRARSRQKPNTDFSDRIQMLLIKRARIVKHARAKVPLAVAVMQDEFQRGQRWIVYCEDTVQLTAVCTALIQVGIQSFPFHSAMDGNRESTLEWLARRGGVVVAIKCLDEGVDIPSVTHALILASSRNPREFIQRRGRVLRKAPGKALAFVHDALVLPPETVEPSDEPDPITVGELARAVQFAHFAENRASAADLQQIALNAGIDWRSLMPLGSEDEES